VENISTASSKVLTLIQGTLKFDPAKWGEPIAGEFSFRIINGIWKVAVLPSGQHGISTEWAFKLKQSANSSFKLKARLVVSGLKLGSGINYNETFDSVAKLVSIGVFLALAAAKD
jgi:hypothetical protein